MKSSSITATRTLCVDLDGTLLATDTLWEALLLLLKKHPLRFVGACIVLLRGKACFKAYVGSAVRLNAASLPIRQDVLDYVRQHKKAGAKVYLTTATCEAIAKRVAARVGVFDAVIASSGEVNLRGRRKLEAIRELLEKSGETEFDYIGDSTCDVPLWRGAGRALVVGRKTARSLPKDLPVEKVFDASRASLRTMLRAIRVHQWSKNLLLFAPQICAHRLTEGPLWAMGGVSFLSFSLLASAFYIFNDLMDLEADRRHATKKHRPLAAGTFSIPAGIMLGMLMLAVSISLAAILPMRFGIVMLTYAAATLTYSWWFKRRLLLDVLMLAGLYTLRIFAGSEAMGIAVSHWLLVFSGMFFLSLAFAKRFAEVSRAGGRSVATPGVALQAVHGRGYYTEDMETIRSTGTACGVASVVLLGLYMNSEFANSLYRRPTLLWGVCPLLLYWLTRVWFFAGRGSLNEDPIAFAIKDRISWLVGLLVVGLMLAAAL